MLPIIFAVFATLCAAGGAVVGVGLTVDLDLLNDEIFFVLIGPLVVNLPSLLIFVDDGFLDADELEERFDRARGPEFFKELEFGIPVLLLLVARLLRCDDLE